MSEGQWIGIALVVTALAVGALAIAGFMLCGVLARVAKALEALRPQAVRARGEALTDRIDLFQTRQVWPPK